MYLNHGHVHVFWDALMRLAESATQSKPAPLSEELGHVVLISPWVTDLPIHTSGLKGEEWRSILGGGLRSINTLSDVLQALADQSCRITLMLVDSEDRALSFSDSASIRKETELVNRLQRNDGNIKILKRFGLHTKCYAFPNAMLEGSANLTYRGMLGNYERLSYVSKTREPERFREGLEMIQSQPRGG